GEMKVRIGITAPLLLETREQGLLRLPYFLERNFSIREQTQHAVWIESKKPLEVTAKALNQERSQQELYAIRGTVKDSELGEPSAILRVSRSGEIIPAWTSDPLDKEGYIIRQTLEEKEFTPPARVVLVMDTSQGMRGFLPEIAGALPKLPAGIEFSLIVASDEVTELSGPIQKGSPEVYEMAASQLKKVNNRGGQDNVSALSRAWDLAAENPHSALVWIHGPQPVLLQAVEEIQQKWERRPNNPRLYEIQAGNGPNQIIEKLDGSQAIESVPRLGSLASDLEGLFARWSGTSKRIMLSRERIERGSRQDLGQETSDHLARLWAHDQVLKLLGSKENTEEALKLATSYQLVTPISGAVVLETQQQYQQAGLEPVNPGTVPTIPEPETWMLMGVVGIVLAWVLYTRFSSRSHALR
ncbi:MAG: hypothetical protein L0Y56_18990, partial [Nitrospira sp.]|nr:hypothetical protein [Nitrospira sp.]